MSVRLAIAWLGINGYYKAFLEGVAWDGVTVSSILKTNNSCVDAAGL